MQLGRLVRRLRPRRLRGPAMSAPPQTVWAAARRRRAAQAGPAAPQTVFAAARARAAAK